MLKVTSVRYATHYTPSIKFVGTRHTFFPKKQAGDAITPHTCSLNGILPGSSECVPAGEFLKNQLPLVVKLFVMSKPQGGTVKNAYSYVSRPLESNEVDSIFKLPPRYQNRPIDLQECDVINAGGAL